VDSFLIDIKLSKSLQKYLFYQLVSELLYFIKSPLRIFPEIHRMLQLSQDTRTGDWFLSGNHTLIKVYGSESQPYLLPKFLKLRVFSLEYIRHRLNSNHVNFLANKKKTSSN
jgi:hypothetical protein